MDYEDMEPSISQEELPYSGIEWLRSQGELPGLEVPKPSLCCNWGWLSPDGDLYGCIYMNHIHLQYALEKKYGIADLERAGWIKLGSSVDESGEKWLDCFYGLEPTQRQLDTILDWCEKYNAELPEFMKRQYD